MARTPKHTPSETQHRSREKPDSEAVIMERMNEALKRAMNTPRETQKEMIERRRRQGKVETKPKR
jgi:macrodomain Ter protein organizer (MatP/YcbG family)